MRVIDSADSAPEALLAAYTPASGRLQGINGQFIPVIGDQDIQALQAALASARKDHSTAGIGRIAVSLGLVHFERMDLLNSRQRMEEACAIFRMVGDQRQLAATLGHLAVVDFYLGDGDNALHEAREAVQIACDTQIMPLSAYLLCTLGEILCYVGKYRAASEAFGDAWMIFTQADDALGMAWWKYAYGREYARAMGCFDMTIEQLEAALPILRGRVSPQAVIETLLTLADCYVHYGNLPRAAQMLHEADSLIAEGKRYWYRPEAYLVKAELAVAECDFDKARAHAYAGLGAAGMSGDLRILTALYRVLAFLLERVPQHVDDAYDALMRATSIGRTRASRLDLALALQQAGLHLRRFANRATSRARGAGFLFEADRLFRDMGLSAVR
jgi:tetratricopeptide (TPR) repeat protein